MILGDSLSKWTLPVAADSQAELLTCSLDQVYARVWGRLAFHCFPSGCSFHSVCFISKVSLYGKGTDVLTHPVVPLEPYAYSWLCLSLFIYVIIKIYAGVRFLCHSAHPLCCAHLAPKKSARNMDAKDTSAQLLCAFAQFFSFLFEHNYIAVKLIYSLLRVVQPANEHLKSFSAIAKKKKKNSTSHLGWSSGSTVEHHA